MSRLSKASPLTPSCELLAGVAVLGVGALLVPDSQSPGTGQLFKWKPTIVKHDSVKYPPSGLQMNFSLVFPINNCLTWLFPFQSTTLISLNANSYCTATTQIPRNQVEGTCREWHSSLSRHPVLLLLGQTTFSLNANPLKRAVVGKKGNKTTTTTKTSFTEQSVCASEM